MIFTMGCYNMRDTFMLLKQDLVHSNTTAIYCPKRTKIKGYQKNRK